MKRIANIAIIVFCLMPFLLTSSYAYTDISPNDAYIMVGDYDNVYILDGRTEAEWMYVGHPGPNKLEMGAFLDGKVVNISYRIWRKGIFIVNPSFISEVDEFFEDIEDVVLITMCRSGKRSVDAALALEAAGYVNVYNIVTGFEGGKDGAGYRTVNGWVLDGLPYTYSGAGYQD